MTRAEEDAGAWADEIDARGGEAIVYPCIRCRPLRTSDLVTDLAQALDDADWLALTSRRGVDAIAELVEEGALTLRRELRICVVGPATATAAHERLGRVDLDAEEGTAASLAETLSAQAQPDATESSPTRVVLAVADRAATTLERALVASGFDARRFEVYTTESVTTDGALERLDRLDLDAIFLASPSAVEGLVARATVPEGVLVVSIGPTTSAAARAAKLGPIVESATRDLDGMLRAMRETLPLPTAEKIV